MSKFLSVKFQNFTSYTPGEQPKDMQYIKLNTNESPFAPSQAVIDAVQQQANLLQLYSDPTCGPLVQSVAELYGVSPAQVLMSNGSDEILNFAFLAFCDSKHPIAFPDISYGFYSVLAELHHIPYVEIPLKDDFTIDYRDYCNINQNIVIANPNAPTGIALSVKEIEEIVKTNPDHLVIIDEAYIDFGGESCVPLVKHYDNLLVVQTFSKSRSLAGARLGFAIASAAIIADLDMIKYATNPYNVNRMTMAAGIAAIQDNDYYMQNCKTICSTRKYVKEQLEQLGFTVLNSKANFLFAKSEVISGKALYNKLKQRGILIRHFEKSRISDFNRITIGTKQQMDALLCAINAILKEE